MLELVKVLPPNPEVKADTVYLTSEQREIACQRVHLQSGREAVLFLEKGHKLMPGELLQAAPAKEPAPADAPAPAPATVSAPAPAAAAPAIASADTKAALPPPEPGQEAAKLLPPVAPADCELVRVELAPEALILAKTDDPVVFAKACYQLAQCIPPIQIGKLELWFAPDPKMEKICKLQGLTVEPVRAPFDPEPHAAPKHHKHEHKHHHDHEGHGHHGHGCDAYGHEHGPEGHGHGFGGHDHSPEGHGHGCGGHDHGPEGHGHTIDGPGHEHEVGHGGGHGGRMGGPGGGYGGGHGGSGRGGMGGPGRGHGSIW